MMCAAVWLGTKAVDEAGEDAHADATRLYREFATQQAPSLAMVNHMLEMCEKRGDSSLAGELEADLERYGLVPNYHSFAFLVGAFGRGGDLPRMQAAFDRMYLSDSKPDMHVIATAVFHYGRSGDVEGAWMQAMIVGITAAGGSRIYDRLRALGLAPDARLNRILLRVCKVDPLSIAWSAGKS